VLGVRQRRRLAGGAAGHEAVDARSDLLLDQIVQRALVHRPVPERGDQRGVDALEHR
jgi:hypothetical protein